MTRNLEGMVGARIRRPERLKDKFVTALYPASNHHGVPARYEPRQFVVRDVRDVDRQPLEPATMRADPLLKRGRFLVIAYDVDRREDRHFYLASLVGIKVRRHAIKVPPTKPCQVVLIHGARVKEVADDGLALTETDAGAWMDTFNRTMRRTPWRAAIVRADSLAVDLPAVGRSDELISQAP